MLLGALDENKESVGKGGIQRSKSNFHGEWLRMRLNDATREKAV